MRLLIALGLLIACGEPRRFAVHPASAVPLTTNRVLCWGDSITMGSPAFGPESYPAQLQALRPDLVVVNGGWGGDVTWNVSRFETLLATFGPFDVVILMGGTNDVILTDPPITPEESAANLVRLARLARRTGAEVYLLTPTPADSPDGQAHTRGIAHALLRMHLPHGMHVADLRDEFTLHGVVPVSIDGVHLTAAGNAIIATFVAALLPSP